MRSFLFFLILVLGFAGCKKPGANATLENQLTSGTWRVSSYIENGDNQTDLFLGYVFDFENAGNIVILFESNVNDGSWVRTNTSDTEPRIRLNFGNTAPLQKLNWEWEATMRTDDIILFRNVNSQGNLSNRSLTLQRR